MPNNTAKKIIVLSFVTIDGIMQHDLVDELWLKMFPLTLGPGKRSFTEGHYARGVRTDR